MKDDRNLEIIRLRKEGYTLKEIGEKVNLTRERVRQILNKNGMESCNPQNLRIRQRNRNAQIIAEYQAGASILDLASKYNLGKNQITIILHRARVLQYKNIKTRIVEGKSYCRDCQEWKLVEAFSKSNRSRFNLNRLCKDCSKKRVIDSIKNDPRLPDIIAMRKDGYSLLEIGLKYGITRGRVSHFIQYSDAGIPTFWSKHRQRRKLSSKVEFNQQLRQEYESGLSMEQLCDKHNLTMPAVYNRLKRAGALIKKIAKPRKSPTRIKAIDGKKPCSSCGELKPFSDYHKMARGAYGLQPNCKECRKVISRKQYEAKKAS